MHQSSYGYIKKYISSTAVIKYLPLSVDTNRFRSSNKTVGIFNPNAYHALTPLRNSIGEASQSYVSYKLEPWVKSYLIDLQHLVKRKISQSKKLIDSYGDIMSQSNYVIACTTTFNISVRKYQEIACSGGSYWVI